MCLEFLKENFEGLSSYSTYVSLRNMLLSLVRINYIENSLCARQGDIIWFYLSSCNLLCECDFTVHELKPIHVWKHTKEYKESVLFVFI